MFIASVAVLAILLAATSYVASAYYKQLRKAQQEYEKARDTVEEIVISFNRELRREAQRIEAVSFRVEGVTVQAESGLRKVEDIEKRITPVEANMNQVKVEVGQLTNLVGSISESNNMMLEKISNLSSEGGNEKLQSFQVTSNKKFTEVDSKFQEIETSKTALDSKIAKLEEQLQKLTLGSRIGNELATPTPVMPIKRDKAMASLTETEIVVLEFLVAEGSKTAPEIKEKVQLSREHTARLMKKLYEEGYLERETGKLPFKYSVKKEMEKLLRKPEPTAL